MARFRSILQRAREVISPVMGAPTLVGKNGVEGGPSGRFSVLVVKIDHLGDLITAVPALKRLRSSWSLADITLLCSAELLEFAQSLDVADRIVGVVTVSSKGRREFVEEAPVLALRRSVYDVAIDLRHDGDTRHLLRAFQARYFVGFASRQPGPRLDVELPELEKNAGRRGAPRMSNRTRLLLLVEAAIQGIRVPVDPREPSEAPSTERRGRTVVVAPGAQIPIKLWRNDHWIGLCDRLIARGFHIVLLGDANDRGICDAIADRLPAASCANLAGELTLAEASEEIANSVLFLGLDTGLAHMASSLGGAAVVLFSGHADHQIWSPDGPNVSVLRNDVPCAPCHVRKLRQCLFEHRCMNLLPLDFVWQIASAKLDAISSRPASSRPDSGGRQS